MFSKNHFSLFMFDKLRWWLFAWRLLVIWPPGSLTTKRSHLATSNLIRQWIKEWRIILICDLIWLGGELDQVESMSGQTRWGRTRHGAKPAATRKRPQSLEENLFKRNPAYSFDSSSCLESSDRFLSRSIHRFLRIARDSRFMKKMVPFLHLKILSAREKLVENGSKLECKTFDL